MILYQLYAFILPAFSPTERKVATPLLFWCRCCSSPASCSVTSWSCRRAIDFLLDFNTDEFNTQIRARDYYSFVILTMVAMGLGFQVPVAILAAVDWASPRPRSCDATAATRTW